jgi:uncharacterized protein YabE (DUF348 family)
MIRNRYLYLVAGGMLLAAGLATAFLLRPVTIQDHSGSLQFRPAALNTGQALAAAGVRLGQHDLVEPALEAPVPLDGQIRIRRAVQAYLWDAGQLRSIAGLERTPAALLEKHGITLGEGSRLLWNGQPVALDEPLPPGQPLVLQLERAQPVRVVSNDREQQVVSRGPTAARALWEAGVRVGPGDWLLVDPGSPLEAGLTLGHASARRLTIRVGEQQVVARSAAETTGAALAEAGVALAGLDYSLPAADQPLPADGQVRVVRVREEIVLDETLVSFESQFAPDPELDLDRQRTLVAGQYGVQVTRERVRYEDGQEVERLVDSDWTASLPVDQTIGYGTKVVTQTADTPDGTIEYYRKVRVYATSYSPCRLGTGDGRCSWTTASGMRLTKGIIGVSLRWFRVMVGQQVYVPGYGFGVIGDYGAVRGMWIDLGFDEENFEEQAIVGWVDLYFLTPVPANILWTLP